MRKVETQASSPTGFSGVPSVSQTHRGGSLCGNNAQSAQRPDRHSPRPITSDLDSTRLNSTQLDSTRLNSTQLDSTRLNSTQLDSTQLDSTRLNSTSRTWSSRAYRFIHGSAGRSPSVSGQVLAANVAHEFPGGPRYELPGDMNRTAKRIFLVSFWPSLAHLGSLERALPASTSSPPTARAVSEPGKVPFCSSNRTSHKLPQNKV
jgi:hypothetical protein